VLGFGWRSWLQYRRTGSTGFRGISASGAVERLAGVGFVVALVVAVSAPVLQQANVIEPVRMLSAVWIQVIGLGIATAGIAATVYAQLEMGDSWRIGVDEKEAPRWCTPACSAGYATPSTPPWSPSALGSLW